MGQVGQSTHLWKPEACLVFNQEECKHHSEGTFWTLHMHGDMCMPIFTDIAFSQEQTETCKHTHTHCTLIKMITHIFFKFVPLKSANFLWLVYPYELPWSNPTLSFSLIASLQKKLNFLFAFIIFYNFILPESWCLPKFIHL